MKKWMLLLSLVLMIVIVNCGQAQAAEETATKDITFEELNDENVFIKQSRRGTCTLASSAMIMRRAAMLAGFENWEDITESSVGSVAWREGVGISWTFTYDGVPLQLLENRPDVKIAEMTLASAYYTTNKARAAFYPGLNITATAGWTNGSGISVANPGQFMFQALASLAQPIFNNGKLVANLKVSKAEEKIAQNDVPWCKWGILW